LHFRKIKSRLSNVNHRLDSFALYSVRDETRGPVCPLSADPPVFGSHRNFYLAWLEPMASPPETGEKIVLPLHTEDVSVKRRAVERDVRVRVQTTSHEQLVDEALTHEQVEIERVTVNRPIDAVPPVREEGDLTIIPLVEEVLVVERRLILKEEIHLRRVRTTTRHREAVTLRDEEVVIERAEPGASLSALASDLAPIPKSQTLRKKLDE
jgi:stress response protein YsnF